MATILTALALYFAFVILVFIARFVLWIIQGIKQENARIKAKQALQARKTEYNSLESTPDNTLVIVERNTESKPINAKTIAAYEMQKQIILDRIADIEETLDLAPGKRERETLQVNRIKLYGDLANIENKIYRVSK